MGKDIHDAAGFRVTIYPIYLITKYPGMSILYPPADLPFQINLRHARKGTAAFPENPFRSPSPQENPPTRHRSPSPDITPSHFWHSRQTLRQPRHALRKIQDNLSFFNAWQEY
jgi:hypothetical protein